MMGRKVVKRRDIRGDFLLTQVNDAKQHQTLPANTTITMVYLLWCRVGVPRCGVGFQRCRVGRCRVSALGCTVWYTMLPNFQKHELFGI